MPFTPAHVAAVLPVVGRRARWVVPAAWVVGSMAPDLVYFTPLPWVRPLSHSLLGIATLDLALGAVVLVAWWSVVGPAARDLLPPSWRRRVARPVAPPGGRWGWAVVGLLAGSVTHVVWDAFTHHDGWVVERVAWFREPLLAGQPAYSVVQDASGLLGLVAVATYAAVRLRREAPVHDDAAVLSARERAAAWTTFVALPVVLCASITVWAAPRHEFLVNALFVGFTRAVGLCAVAALAAAIGWHRLRRRRVPAATLR